MTLTIFDSIIIEFDLQQHSYQPRSLAELNFPLKDKTKVYWIHCDLNDQVAFKQMIEKIPLANTVIDLCQRANAIKPRLINHDDTIMMRIPSLLNEETENVGELILQLTDRFCFTASFDPLSVLRGFNSAYQQGSQYAQTPCFILFLILDHIINEYANLLFGFELIADQLDLQVRSSQKNIYNDVMTVKKNMMKVRRNLVTIREILMRISGKKISVISEACRLSLTNLLNQSEMIFHETDSIRDMLNNLLAQIDNALMQKMNETMRVLTAFASVFLPLSLITGIYGMNFYWMPELTWRYGYYYALGLLVISAVILLYIFKRKKWF